MIGFDMILTEWSFKTCFCLSVSWEHFFWVTPASRHVCHDKGFNPFPYLPWVISGYVWCLQVKLVSRQTWVCSNSHLFFPTVSLSHAFFSLFLIWWGLGWFSFFLYCLHWKASHCYSLKYKTKNPEWNKTKNPTTQNQNKNENKHQTFIVMK